jgi:hypothetical protein
MIGPDRSCKAPHPVPSYSHAPTIPSRSPTFVASHHEKPLQPLAGPPKDTSRPTTHVGSVASKVASSLSLSDLLAAHKPPLHHLLPVLQTLGYV